MRNFRMNRGGGNSVGQFMTTLIGDEARVAELSEYGSQLLGMFLANMSGTAFSWLVEKVVGDNSPKWLNPNLLSSLLGGVVMWKLPDLLRLVGMDELADELDNKESIWGNMRHGATLLFGLSVGIQSLGYVGKKMNFAIPGFTEGSVLDSLRKEIDEASGNVSGVGMLDIWSTDDYDTKMNEFQASVDELKSKLAELGMPTGRDAKEVYMYAQRLLSYSTVNLENAENFAEESDWATVENLLENVKEDTNIAQGLITGLAAQPETQQTAEPVVPQQVVPQQVVPSQQEVIENVETGQQIQVQTPPVQEAVIAEKTGVGEPETAGKAFYLDNILPWSQYVAKQTGWTPTQAALSFVLKYLANNGHIWAYGPDSVLANRNYAPYNVSGVQGNSPAYAIATVGGVRRTFKLNNSNGVRRLLLSVLGR